MAEINGNLITSDKVVPDMIGRTLWAELMQSGEAVLELRAGELNRLQRAATAASQTLADLVLAKVIETASASIPGVDVGKIACAWDATKRIITTRLLQGKATT